MVENAWVSIWHFLLCLGADIRKIRRLERLHLKILKITQRPSTEHADIYIYIYIYIYMEVNNGKESDNMERNWKTKQSQLTFSFLSFPLSLPSSSSVLSLDGSFCFTSLLYSDTWYFLKFERWFIDWTVGISISFLVLYFIKHPSVI